MEDMLPPTDELGLDREGQWRMEMFLELGFGAATSWALAVARADWHRAKDLLGKGASHRYVVEEFIEL